MTNELKLPLRFKCPRCKTDKGVMQTLAMREKSEGILAKDVPVGYGRHSVVLADEGQLQSGALAGKKVRVVFSFADICSNCGTQYVYLVEVKEIEIPEKKIIHRDGSKIILPPDIGFPPPPGGLPGRN